VIRSTVKLSGEGSTSSRTSRIVDVPIAPGRIDEVAAALSDLVRKMPDHPGILPLYDAGLRGGRPFLVVADIEGEPLDVALAAYGPAGCADALPRLRRIASALDYAASHGLWHGALSPRDILVSVDDTRVAGLGLHDVLWRAGATWPCETPYAAPEVLRGGRGSPAADQHALAAIAYEWLLGGPLPDDGPSREELSRVPGIDAARLEQALLTARATDPGRRFASCAAFVEALASAAEAEVRREEPQSPAAVVLDLPLDASPNVVSDLSVNEALGGELGSGPAPGGARAPGAAALSGRARGRGEAAVLAAALAGGVAVGATLAWMWRHHAGVHVSMGAFTQHAAPATSIARAGEPGPQVITDASLNPPRDDRIAARGGASPPADHEEAHMNVPARSFGSQVPRDTAPAPESGTREPAGTGAAQPQTTARDTTRRVAGAAVRRDELARRDDGARGALLVHSVPAGALVTIDGEPRGTTPLVVRGLGLGTVIVAVSSAGYETIERRVTLTGERPSRTIEVDLTERRDAASTREARAGSLLIESRPAGAAVLLDGRLAGITPVTIADLAPRLYTVTLEHPGYRPVTTRVGVRAGERARVAARLEEGSVKR
jgi:hypothetical protein